MNNGNLIAGWDSYNEVGNNRNEYVNNVLNDIFCLTISLIKGLIFMYSGLVPYVNNIIFNYLCLKKLPILLTPLC